ncbi:unnamed protein product, partial [Mesorhabditis belari]|uniref:Uncharacterized protein n=1 Tax=Mesorhabditis belari TaxID=2138241 RepID=A0AAF3JAS9_9BILA
MRLFLPYTFLHAFTFLAYTFLFLAYRTYLNPPEPTYSAAGGFIFCQMYFTAISPWIIYWIIVISEENRMVRTKRLMQEEKQANDLYFNSYRSQWKCESRKSHSNNFFIAYFMKISEKVVFTSRVAPIG